MCMRADVEKNAFLEFFPLKFRNQPIVLADESKLEDNFPQVNLNSAFAQNNEI